MKKIDYDNLFCCRCGSKVPNPGYRLTFKGASSRVCKKCLCAIWTRNARIPSDKNAAISVSDTAKQVIFGSILGDGHLERPPLGSKNWGLGIKHSLKQERYLRFKVQMLGSLVGKIDYPKERVRVRCIRHPYFTEMAKQFVPNKKKIFRDMALVNVGPLALAVWYMDDGNITQECVRSNGRIHAQYIRFCTHSCSVKDRLALKSMLRRVAGVVHPSDCVWNNPRNPKKPYHGIRLRKDDSMRFLHVVSPFVYGSGMEYKMGNLFITEKGE